MEKHSTAASPDINEKPPSTKGSSHASLEKSDGEVVAEKVAVVHPLDAEWEVSPENPRNWTSRRKWTSMNIVSLYTFLPPFASSMVAPGLPQIGLNYGTHNPTLIAMVLSSFQLSFAIGPLILAPLSEMYGRRWVLHIANLVSIAFTLACAFSPTIGSLIGFRFLAGLAGSAPIAVGVGCVGDLFGPHERASAMAIYSLGPLVGPIIGPIIGGFVTEKVGIKWIFIIVAIATGVSSVIAIPLLEETYAPVLRFRKARKADDLEAANRVHPIRRADASIMQLIWTNMSRPILLFFRSFICFILSLYVAFLYGIYYLMFSTFGDLFQNTYGFGPGVGGLVYLGLGVGLGISGLFGASWGDKLYKKLAEKNGGKGTPEMRIPAVIIGSLFIPIALLWYGWSAQAKVHWIMPIIGSGIFGFAMMAIFPPIYVYLVDAYTYAASAAAAASVFRSFLAFGFPLFGTQMFDALGLGGGNSLLAGLAIILGIPFPIWIYYKGAQLRARSKYTK